MYIHLNSIGIENVTMIDRYSLRQENGNDILKIYFKKEKGEFFAKSIKLKFPRQRKKINNDINSSEEFKEIYEINPILCSALDELDIICQQEQNDIDLKRKILTDIQHLEQVMTNKIKELKDDLEKLTKK